MLRDYSGYKLLSGNRKNWVSATFLPSQLELQICYHQSKRVKTGNPIPHLSTLLALLSFLHHFSTPHLPILFHPYLLTPRAWPLVHTCLCPCMPIIIPLSPIITLCCHTHVSYILCPPPLVIPSDFDMMHHASASILNPPVLEESTLYRACFPLGDPAGAPYRNPSIPLTCMNL